MNKYKKGKLDAYKEIINKIELGSPLCLDDLIRNLKEEKNNLILEPEKHKAILKDGEVRIVNK